MSSRSFPLASILQYAVLGMIGYVLAGAPLLSLLTNSTYESRKARASFGQPSALSHDKAAGLIIPERNLSCAEHTYKGLHVLSREPLVVYVEGFLRGHEVEHVVNVRYAISMVLGPRSFVQLQVYPAYSAASDPATFPCFA
jgi:prolyl 4-hydroxylase